MDNEKKKNWYTTAYKILVTIISLVIVAGYVINESVLILDNITKYPIGYIAGILVVIAGFWAYTFSKKPTIRNSGLGIILLGITTHIIRLIIYFIDSNPDTNLEQFTATFGYWSVMALVIGMHIKQIWKKEKLNILETIIQIAILVSAGIWVVSWGVFLIVLNLTWS